MNTNRKRTGIPFVEVGERHYLRTIYTGSFRDSFPYLQANPAAVESALMRGLRLIEREGIDPVATEQARRIWGDPELFSYNVFSNLYGIEPMLHRLVSGMSAGARGGEHAYSAFFLFGPPASGKSQITARLKQIYAGGEQALMLAGSQMRAHPLSLLPMIPVLATKHGNGSLGETDMRKQFLTALNLQDALRFDSARVKEVFGGATPSIEELCKLPAEQFVSAIVYGLGFGRAVRSVVQFPDFAVIEKLIASTDPVNELANWQLQPFTFLDEKAGSVGVASLKESEPLKFDKAEMIGEEDPLRFGIVNAQDSQMVLLNGVYNRAHRGIAEFVEAAKNSKYAFRSMLEATQDRTIPAPAPLANRALGIDVFIVCQTNEQELRTFLAEPGNAPYGDRFFLLETPHVVQHNAIGKVITKMWRRSDYAETTDASFVHLEPCIVELLARVLSFTRLSPDKEVKSMMALIDILAGDYFRIKDTGQRHNGVDIVRRAGSRLGMSGQTNRFVMKILDEVAGSALLTGRRSITSLQVLEALKLEIRRMRDRKGEKTGEAAGAKSSSELAALEDFVKGVLEKWRAKRLAQDVRMAVVSSQNGSDLRASYVSRYVDIIGRMLESERDVSSEDKKYVGEIEAMLGITSAQAERYRDELRKFRNDVLGARDAHEQKFGAEFLPHTFFGPLKKAIDRYMVQRISPSIAISILRADSIGTAQDKEQLNGTIARLISDFGYDDYSAREVIAEVQRKNFLEMTFDEDDE